ncbi:putative phage abortive infection protein [Algoriphagus winogradskyi]|uniref:Phage abortive infection protein n=1 Tax=Algoriphagus winogradskyi TaxID=237017 RepID=A0ABY1PJJ6_9BACT|nr:putative phage abortive infection protein [Algoriphagus winogradskyi]SMP34127.1 Putative phage abortive infection protein [Algoriphagus winogradskyi]
MKSEIYLEKEINKAATKIEGRQEKIEKDLEILAAKIGTYTTWAWVFVWAGIFIGVFSIIVYLCTNTEKGFGLNLLGDFMAGTVSSIWSLAGLFFIYVAFLGQKQQLLNQQLEIMYSQLEVKYTRLELAGQKKEMKQQNETLKLQKFENTFFNLLSLHHQIVEGIDEIEAKITSGTTRQPWGRSASHSDKSTYQHVTIKGRDVFKKWFIELSGIIEQQPDKGYLDHYLDIYSIIQTDFGHYFRNLYRIIKFIDEANFNSEPTEDFNIKYSYTSMVRAQLSDFELLFLFYNCLSVNGIEKFKPLVEKYCLFKNLPQEKLHDPLLIELYKSSAFRQNQ